MIQTEPYYMIENISEIHLIQELLNSLLGELWEHFYGYVFSLW
jgi:hypothetical protein